MAHIKDEPLKPFEQTLPDTSNISAAVLLCLADSDRGSVFGWQLDINTKQERDSVVEELDWCGWPVIFDDDSGNFLLDSSGFEDSYGDEDFVDDRGVPCDCRDLRQHLRHMINQSRNFRRFVFQEAIMFLLYRKLPAPSESQVVEEELAQNVPVAA